jgi:hypothetical protein
MKAMATTAPAEPHASLATASDKVTISDAAKAMADRVIGATQARTPFQEKLLADAAASDPQVAERMARDMADSPSMIAYDISDYLAAGIPFELNKLSSTGRIVDEAFKERFAAEAPSIDAQRLALYNAEKAKGTNPVEILSKLIDFTNMQSTDYLEATGWTAK